MCGRKMRFEVTLSRIAVYLTEAVGRICDYYIEAALRVEYL